MNVLLDECIPRKFKLSIPDWECGTVPEAGFAGKKNGFLLDLAESEGFDIFVTMDKGLEYQQRLTGRNLAILLLRAKSNRLADLLPLVAGSQKNTASGAQRRGPPYPDDALNWRKTV